MRRATPPRGFALLMTLVLLMIAAIALAAVARKSTTEALAVQEATESLQRRWAVTSCRATLLQRTGRQMTQAEDQATSGPQRSSRDQLATRPTAHRWVTTRLAGIRYDLVFTDEQAKLNPTRLLSLADELQVKLALEALAASSAASTQGVQAQGVTLRPLLGPPRDAKPGEGNKHVRRFVGYGQLLESVDPAVLLGTPGRPGIAEYVTCWGEGQLNLRRAPDQVVRHALGPVVGPKAAAELIALRREARRQIRLGPDDQPVRLDAQSLTKRLTAVAGSRKVMAGGLVTDSSQCHGLWVVAHGKTRSWYTLSIREVIPPPDDAAQQGRPGQSPPPQGQGSPNPSRRPEDDEPEHEPVRYYDVAW